jgi:hypothetical protein
MGGGVIEISPEVRLLAPPKIDFSASPHLGGEKSLPY